MDADRGSALRRRAVIGTKRATENVSFADAAVIGRPARFPANKTHTNHKYACHIWADPATLPAKVRHGARWGMLELQDMAGHLIRRLHQISVSVFTERMRDAGFDLTPVQFATLAALEAHPDVDQATLAGLIAHDRVTIGGAVDRMEAKGLISRRVSPQDRRARHVRLTDAGRSTLDRALPLVRTFQHDILSGLTEAESAQFMALLRKTTAAGNTQSRAPLQQPKPR